MTASVRVPTAPALTTWRRVELAKAGTYGLQVGGEQTFTPDDFAAAIAAVDCPAVGRPIVKLGHQDTRGAGLRMPGAEPQLDGEPALGWVTNMALTDDRQTLIADLVGMPGWFGQIAASAYPSRSIEGARDFTCAFGHSHPFALSAVAMLGITPPAIPNLTSLQDHVRALYGVAASTDSAAPSGEPFALTFPAEEAPVTTGPVQIAAALTVDDVRKAFYADAPADAWVCEIQLDPLQLIVVRDDGEYARVPVTVNADGSVTFGSMIDVEVSYVDEASGSGDAVAAAAGKPTRVRFGPLDGPQQLAAAESAPPVSDPQPTQPQGTPPAQPAEVPATPDSPAAEPEPTTEPEEGDNVSLSEVRSRLGLTDDADEATVLAALDELKTKATQPAEPPAELVAAAAKADEQATQFAAAIGQIQTLSQELAAVKAEKVAEKKAAFFAAAVGAGKVAPADRASWEVRYDQAPDLITEIINAMAPGTAVPVAAAGYTGGGEETADLDAEFAGFFPPGSLETTGKGN